VRARLLLGFLVFAALIAIALEVPLGLSLASNDRGSAMATLERDGTSLSVLLGEALERGDKAGAAQIAATFARQNDVGVIVVSGGKVAVASNPGMSEELQDPGIPSILSAAAHGRVAGIEPAGDGDDEQLYSAVPVDGGASSGAPTVTGSSAVLLVTAPAGPLEASVRQHWLELLGFGLAVLGFAAGLGWFFARSLVRPLRDIEGAVAKIGAGALSTRAPPGKGPPELSALAGAVNTMATRLGELMSSQRAFVADASHQLRTPLTALRLRLEASVAESSGEENITKALYEVERLGRLIDGLLALARAEGTRDVVEPVDVDAAIRDRIVMWQPLAEEQGIALAAATATGGTARALTGRGYLEQILDNLLDNAIGATPAGKRIEVSRRGSGRWVEVHVVDQGHGMPGEDRRRAFDRFWRGSGKAAGGSGLGLAIVEQLVRVSGGTVELLESASGGIDATVRLQSERPGSRSEARH
jgi:signal transduction histidine kinase